MKSIKTILSEKISVSIFFLIALFIGVSIYDDYGVPWDEGIANRLGIINAFEINQKLGYAFFSKEKVADLTNKAGSQDKIVPLSQFKDRRYGAIFEMVLLAPAVAFKKLNDIRAIYLLRHLTIFLIFWFSLICFYLLLRRRYDNWLIPLAGTLALFLSPRIFAHSFYNSKDLIFLAMFIIASFTSYRFIEEKSYKWAMLNALACALLIDTRLPGIILVAITVAFFFLDYLKSSDRKSINFRPVIAFGLALPILIILFWPYLWSNPVGNFIEALQEMSKFPFQPDMIYMGNLINAGNVPWHYIPVWIFISTPLIYSIFFLPGVWASIVTLYKNKLYSSNETRLDLFFLSMFFVPILPIILLHSTLYNEWRHVFFLYPGFILISVRGFVYLYELLKNSRVGRYSLTSLALVSMVLISAKMVKMHPYEMVYFNCLMPDKINELFETEYWGLSYREGLEYIAKNNSATETKVYQEYFTPMPGSLRILEESLRKKISVVKNLEEADYILSNFQLTYYNYDNYNKLYNLKKNQEVHAIYADGLKILGIFKIDKSNKIDTSGSFPVFKLQIKS